MICDMICQYDGQYLISTFVHGELIQWIVCRTTHTSCQANNNTRGTDALVGQGLKSGDEMMSSDVKHVRDTESLNRLHTIIYPQSITNSSGTTIYDSRIEDADDIPLATHSGRKFLYFKIARVFNVYIVHVFIPLVCLYRYVFILFMCLYRSCACIACIFNTVYSIQSLVFVSFMISPVSICLICLELLLFYFRFIIKIGGRTNCLNMSAVRCFVFFFNSDGITS